MSSRKQYLRSMSRKVPHVIPDMTARLDLSRGKAKLADLLQVSAEKS